MSNYTSLQTQYKVLANYTGSVNDGISNISDQLTDKIINYTSYGASGYSTANEVVNFLMTTGITSGYSGVSGAMTYSGFGGFFWIGFNCYDELVGQ